MEEGGQRRGQQKEGKFHINYGGWRERVKD